MENNKLEQLTNKLYQEGLSKGRAEADKVLAEAHTQAKKIVAEAEARAREIARKASTEAEDMQKNALTEIALAGREATARLKGEIAELITARTLAGPVAEATLDGAFVKDMLLAVAAGWSGSSADKVSLVALLPAARRYQLDKAFVGSAADLLKAGVEVGYSDDVRTGFRVGAKGGGYYIDFSDESFEALLGQYLREKLTGILFAKK